jgi:AAA domain
MAPPHDKTIAGRLIAIADYKEKLRVQRDAQIQLDAEDNPPGTITLPTLRDRLATPPPAIRWRIDGWQPRNSRVMVAAAFKAGKTTLRTNLVRSLVDGDPFLGVAAVTPVTGVVIDLDFEMSAWQLDDWYRTLGIVHDDRVHVVSLRGQARAFNLLNPTVRAEWVHRLRGLGAEYLTLDCLRPILDALGLDENRDAGRFLVALDALLTEAGIAEACVLHHMGHTSERSRGDSRLRDWPDVEWRLVRQDEDVASARYVSAYGREVDRPEVQLTYHGGTRQLAVTGGSRREQRITGALDAICAVLSEQAPLSGRAIKYALLDAELSRGEIESALAVGVRAGALLVEVGPRRAKLYSKNNVPA